jgi:hypothetical protein
MFYKILIPNPTILLFLSVLLGNFINIAWTWIPQSRGTQFSNSILSRSQQYIKHIWCARDRRYQVAYICSSKFITFLSDVLTIVKILCKRVDFKHIKRLQTGPVLQLLGPRGNQHVRLLISNDKFRL